jgi:hypothetical protein
MEAYAHEETCGLVNSPDEIIAALKNPTKVGAIFIKGDEHPTIIWERITYNVRKRRLTIKVDRGFSLRVQLGRIEGVQIL